MFGIANVYDQKPWKYFQTETFKVMRYAIKEHLAHFYYLQSAHDGTNGSVYMRKLKRATTS